MSVRGDRGVRSVRSVRCVGGRQSVDSWDLESPVTSLSVLLTHPALPPRHSYAPDTCNNSQQHLHTPHCTPHCREHCRVLQLLWRPTNLPHIKTDEEMMMKMMFCEDLQRQYHWHEQFWNSSSFNHHFFLPKALDSLFYFKWAKHVLKYHGKSHLLLRCDLLLPILQHWLTDCVDITC